MANWKCIEYFSEQEQERMTVESGHTNNQYFDYEIDRIKCDGGKVYYNLLVEGDHECYFKTQREARAYAKHLFDE